jgi:prophage regulatory protein
MTARERERRRKQRSTPRPAYRSLADADAPPTIETENPRSTSTQNAIARPQPPPTTNRLPANSALPPGRIFLRMRQVLAKTGLATSSLYELIDQGQFPAPVPLSDRRVAWVLDEVDAWIEARIAERDQPQPRRRTTNREVANAR